MVAKMAKPAVLTDQDETNMTDCKHTLASNGNCYYCGVQLDFDVKLPQNKPRGKAQKLGPAPAEPLVDAIIFPIATASLDKVLLALECVEAQYTSHKATLESGALDELRKRYRSTVELLSAMINEIKEYKRTMLVTAKDVTLAG